MSLCHILRPSSVLGSEKLTLVKHTKLRLSHHVRLSPANSRFLMQFLPVELGAEWNGVTLSRVVHETDKLNAAPRGLANRKTGQ